MSRLQDLYSAFEDLWKGRKAMSADQLTELAGKMDASLGPWPKENGTRQDAVKHFLTFGRKGSLAHKNAAPGTPESMAYNFATDQMKHARANVTKRAPSLSAGDTLTGAIDKDHIDHYATHWATHFDILDHAPRMTKEVDDEAMPVMPGTNKVQQLRTVTGQRRIKHMKSQGQSHAFTMDDLNTIHTGVERAIQTGKVKESDANRYHVMRAAMHKVHKMHPDSHPGLPFEPSLASVDTTALKVMHAGIEHLDDTGFREAKSRLGPALSSAVASHEAFPYSSGGRKAAERRAVSVNYPDLHRMGSLEHTKQATLMQAHLNRVGRSRGTKETKQFEQQQVAKVEAKKTAQEAAKKGPDLPASWEEYTQLRDAGKITDPAVHTEMERRRRAERAMAKSFAAVRLLKDLKDWRRTA